MGFVARKSFKVMPGVRMTVSKSGLSASAGIRGARVSVNSKGHVRGTAGIPGSGIYYTQRLDSGSRRSTAPRTAAAPPAPTPLPNPPGLGSPKWQRDLFKAIQGGRMHDLASIAQAHPVAAPVIGALDGLNAMSSEDDARAREVLRWVWSTSVRIEDEYFVRTYLPTSTVTINIADGVSGTFPISRDAVGMALVELEQKAGSLDAAIATAEQLDPSVFAAVSLCELYLEARKYDEVISTTNRLTNDDDPTCLLLAFRGVALREQGNLTAAREAFKEALKSKSRDIAIRHFALVERAKTQALDGKKAMARKDLERVLAEDASHPGVRQLMDQLAEPSGSVSTPAEVRTTPQAPVDVAVDRGELPSDLAPPVGADEGPTGAAALGPTPPPPPPPTTYEAASTPPPPPPPWPAAPRPTQSNVTPNPPAKLWALDGYGVEVEFDGTTLTLTAKNGVSAVALFGSPKTRRAAVPRNQIRSVDYSEATRLVNGHIDLTTNGGYRYQVHFRWGQRNQPWRDLATMITASS